MSKILIIDDDKLICQVLVSICSKLGHETDYSLTIGEGLGKLFSGEFDILFLDVNLPDGNGLDAIEMIKDHLTPPEIIIMTGDSEPDGAELAMKSKAWDYIQKSGSHEEFKFSLIRALEYRNQKQSITMENRFKRELIVGESRQIKTCLQETSNASKNDIPVLITGETGTGKELFARAIHENSTRKKNDLIILDCAALPENLVESLLFGHVKGAFTGADSDRVGLIQLADKGTLFLDEVGELPLTLQKKFLRVLQEKKFRPVGSKKEITSDFRLTSATHRDLPKMIKESQFREDFYFRIASIKIKLPPLRDRASDIPSLIAHHMDWKSKFLGTLPHELSQEFTVDLHDYNWPGNVRELFNAIDYASSDAYMETKFFSKHLPEHIRTYLIKKKIKKSHNLAPEHFQQEKKTDTIVELKDHIERTKYEYMQKLLSITNGNIKEACKLSGLSRGHLYRLLKQYEIQTP